MRNWLPRSALAAVLPTRQPSACRPSPDFRGSFSVRVCVRVCVRVRVHVHVRLTIHHKFRSNLAELRQKACRARLLMNGRLPDANEGATWCFA
jgi:hypothetical protein